jgi:hypothetical protein
MHVDALPRDTNKVQAALKQPVPLLHNLNRVKVVRVVLQCPAALGHHLQMLAWARMARSSTGHTLPLPAHTGVPGL